MKARDLIERHLNQKAGLVLTSEENADTIISTLAAAGFAIVPRVPTEKMWAAYNDAWTYGSGHDQPMREWKAMLEAADEQ